MKNAGYAALVALAMGCGDGSGATTTSTADTEAGTESDAPTGATPTSTSPGDATSTASDPGESTGASTSASTGEDPDSSSGSGSSGGEEDMTAAEAVAQMAIGWNVGNTLDAPEGETAWGNPLVTEALVQAVAAEGFGVVRIPVTWSLHLGPGPDYTIDPAWLDRVEEVVGYAVDNDLYAIINLHHDGADGYTGVEWLSLNDATGAVTPANNDAVRAQFVAVWEQIAARFADHDHHLVFESMNEIHDGYGPPMSAYYDIINDLNQTFVDVIRTSGGNNASRYLVVPGYNTNIEYTLAGFELPVDTMEDRLILSVHYYDPWSFAGEASTPVWGAAYPMSDPWGQEDWVLDRFSLLGDTYVDDGLPVIVGEYGAVQQDGFEDYRRYYLEYVTKAAHDEGIVPIYWDNGGEGSGPDSYALFERDSGDVLRPVILEAMMRAIDDPYSIEDVQGP